jgi:hypothetical protein
VLTGASFQAHLSTQAQPLSPYSYIFVPWKSFRLSTFIGTPFEGAQHLIGKYEFGVDYDSN